MIGIKDKKSTMVAGILIALYICLIGPKTVVKADLQFQIGDETVWFDYSGEEKELVIPEGVTEIGVFQFAYNENLEKITIPDSVTKINDRAFEECINLKEVVGGKNVTVIGDYAFDSCRSLKEFIFGSKLTTIGWFAFGGCKSLQSVELSNSVKSVGDMAFCGASGLKKVKLSTGMTSLKYGVFQGADSLESIVIPDSITTIGGVAFEHCDNLKQVTMSKNVKVIELAAFMNCKKLTKLDLPDTLKEISQHAISDVKYITASKNSKAEEYAKFHNIDIKYKNTLGLHKTKTTLLVKDKDVLHFNTIGSGSVKWTTSNKKVVTVSGGTIVGKKPGTATITAVFNNRKYACKVTVLKRTVDNRMKQVEANYNLKNASDYDKIWAVNHWLAYNIDYDINAYGVEKALLNGKAKCDGYSRAFSSFMDYFNIPSQYESSWAKNHAWNIVQINNKWYNIDTTWNTDHNLYSVFLVTDAVRNQGGFIADYQTVKCNSKTIDKKYKSPQLEKTSLTVKKGKKAKLNMLNTKKKISWFSTNSKVVTVDKKGNLNAKKKGKAMVTATIRGRDITYVATIIVK